jgi:hypothetical protein
MCRLLTAISLPQLTQTTLAGFHPSIFIFSPVATPAHHTGSVYRSSHSRTPHDSGKSILTPPFTFTPLYATLTRLEEIPMKKTGLTTLCLSLTLFVFSASYAYDLTLTNTPAKVYFSPGGGCTEAIVGELNVARAEILVQAYSFYLNAHRTRAPGGLQEGGQGVRQSM